MTSHPSKPKLVAVLWFVAGGLAFVGVAISLVKDHEPSWGVMTAGLFCFVMGINSLRRKKEIPPAA